MKNRPSECEVCGRRMQKGSKWGVCRLTEQCSREFDRRRRGRGLGKCPVCGGLLNKNNKTGVCRRTSECARARDLRKNFDISLEEYNHMFSLQDGKCAICLQESRNGRMLAVDHNHNTGEIRGLLCGRCNICIGQMEDNVVLLQSAINYLKAGESCLT